MKIIGCFWLVLALQIMAFLSPVICRVLAPNDHHHLHHNIDIQPGPTSSPEHLQATFNTNQEERSKGVDKIGSKPPSCENKCYGCEPCEAIQVPTISGAHFGVQYTNYEPEGWKCKCGPSFYSP